MKFLLLKTLLLRKRRDEGFTLPMVIAIGLVMVLLSAVNLVQSGEENLMAISQEGSSDALAAAELGVSRYRDFLINNRVLAINDSAQWTNPSIPSVVGTTNTLVKVCTDTDEIANWADTTTWHDIDVNGNTIGSYRLVDYEYDQNPLDGNNDDDNGFDQFTDANNDFSPTPDEESDARGFLTIQGQDRIGSIAQIRVEIPIGVNTQDLRNLSPALWIQQSTISNADIGNVNINSDATEPTPPFPPNTKIFSESIADGDNSDDGNIVLYDPATAGSNGCGTSTTNLAGENTISDPRPLPPVMNQENFEDTFSSVLNFRELDGDISDERHSSYVSGNPVPNNYPSNYYNPDTKKIVLGTAYDETNNPLDNPIGSGSQQALNSGITINGQNENIFYYSTDAQNLVIDDGEAIIGDGDSRVIIYVDGDLDITTGTDGVRLVNSSHQSESFSTTPPGIARYLEIHVDGNVDISGNGTLDITGLLRVDGTVNITGSPTVNVIGSIWANDWDASSGATINIDTDQTTSNGELVSEYNFYSITSERTPAPLTYRPSGWERQEAN